MISEVHSWKKKPEISSREDSNQQRSHGKQERHQQGYKTTYVRAPRAPDLPSPFPFMAPAAQDNVQLKKVKVEKN